MYTISDKNYMEALMSSDPQTYDYIKHLQDNFNNNLHLGCHNIRNVIALLSGNSQLLELSHPELMDDPRWQSIRSDMDYLINFMSAVNKYRYAHVLKKTTFSLQKMFSKLARLYAFNFQLNLSSEIDTIYADSDKIQYVISSILNNILDEGNTSDVIINSCIESNRLIISIKDSLPAPETDISINMFCAFNTNKPDHAGLSLATSYLIIMAHDGELTYSYDNGNIFTITMQIQNSHQTF